MLFTTLEPSSLPVVVAQSDERHANRAASVLEWYDRYKLSQNMLTNNKRKKYWKFQISQEAWQ